VRISLIDYAMDMVSIVATRKPFARQRYGTVAENNGVRVIGW
jgi:hypothetical protein